MGETPCSTSCRWGFSTFSRRQPSRLKACWRRRTKISPRCRSQKRLLPRLKVVFVFYPRWWWLLHLIYLIYNLLFIVATRLNNGICMDTYTWYIYTCTLSKYIYICDSMLLFVLVYHAIYLLVIGYEYFVLVIIAVPTYQPRQLLSNWMLTWILCN